MKASQSILKSRNADLEVCNSVSKLFLLCSLALAILMLGVSGAHAAKPVKVDVLFMNHGPLMSTVSKMKSIFSGYGNELSISWYDFDTKEGEQFMGKMGLKGHIPLIIWIDGTPKRTVGAKEITFAGFPTGSGPPMFRGKWTMDELKTALDQATGKK